MILINVFSAPKDEPLKDLITSLLVAGSFYAALQAPTLCVLPFRSYHEKERPTDYLLLNLLYAIISIRQDWDSRPRRNDLLRFLENAARCIENAGRQILMGDQPSTYWMRTAYQSRAQAIRELKMAVAVPKADTQNWLEKELRRILALIATGDWDGLPVNKYEIAKILPWWRAAMLLLRAVAIAVLPLIGIVVISQFSALVPSFLPPYLIAGALLWALVNLILIIDPSAGQKISTMKDVVGLFAGGSRPKE